MGDFSVRARKTRIILYSGVIMADGGKIADRVRNYRERLQMTIEDLAEKSGVDAGVIRAIEAGDVYPILGVLIKLSRALGQRLGTFMDDQFQSDPVIMRADERAEGVRTHRAGSAGSFTYFPLGRGKTDRHMDPFYIEIAPNAEAPFSAHEGEEIIIVVEGEVELTYGGETYLLWMGDSAHYNSVVTHRVRAVGDKPAAIHAVVFMPF